MTAVVRYAALAVWGTVCFGVLGCGQNFKSSKPADMPVANAPQPSPPEKPTEDNRPISFTIDPTDLYLAFVRNEADANLRYEGKRLRIDPTAWGAPRRQSDGRYTLTVLGVVDGGQESVVLSRFRSSEVKKLAELPSPFGESRNVYRVTIDGTCLGVGGHQQAFDYQDGHSLVLLDDAVLQMTLVRRDQPLQAGGQNRKK